MLGIYFSGTGNTQHCVETFVKQYDENCIAISIEAPDIGVKISEHDMLVLGYPIYYSNAPKIVQDFIHERQKHFANKKIFIIATMALFSGDGTGCTARILKKYGTEIIGGLHLKMPDCIGDEKALKKSVEGNQKIIVQADNKILSAVEKLKAGNPPQEGLNFFCYIGGLFGQRLWFYGKTSTYKNKPNIDNEKCIGCGRCVQVCPMKNISVENGAAISNGRCTLCYRCFSHCPTQALTILGRQVHQQYLFENINS